MLRAGTVIAVMLTGLLWLNPGLAQPPPPGPPPRWLNPGFAQPPPPPPPSQPPPRVMTDTPEYCVHLQHILDRRRVAVPDPSPDVILLSNEGRRMCAEGLVIGGIVRLRMALTLLRTEH